MSYEPSMQRAPLTPEQAAHNRRVILVVAIVFVAVSVTVFVWGLFVANDQRAIANRTDIALRSTAWAILSYAAEHGGSFPTSASDLDHASTDVELPAAPEWPQTRAAALGSGEFMPIQEAEQLVAVTWPPHGNLAPVLSVKGNARGHEALDIVNLWMKQYAQSKATRRAPTSPSSHP